MNRQILFLLCLLLTLVGCSLDVKFSKYAPITSDGWDINDTVSFRTDTLREGGRYGFTCGVRTRRAYPYQELVMMVERKVFRDTLLVLHKREKITCPITKPNGSVTGEGIASKMHECELKDFVMNAGDSVEINITHNMSRPIIPGIVDVGITMEKR